MIEKGTHLLLFEVNYPILDPRSSASCDVGQWKSENMASLGWRYSYSTPQRTRPDDHPVFVQLGQASSSRFNRFGRREEGRVEAG